MGCSVMINKSITCCLYIPTETQVKLNLPQIRQMKYTVARGGMRLLGRAVHSLAKIGDDIYIEPQADSLTLRAVNSSRYVHDLTFLIIILSQFLFLGQPMPLTVLRQPSSPA